MEAGQPVTCLDLMEDKTGQRFASGLVLLPSEQQRGVYRRVGFSTMLMAHFIGSTIEDVTIL